MMKSKELKTSESVLMLILSITTADSSCFCLQNCCVCAEVVCVQSECRVVVSCCCTGPSGCNFYADCDEGRVQQQTGIFLLLPRAPSSESDQLMSYISILMISPLLSLHCCLFITTATLTTAPLIATAATLTTATISLLPLSRYCHSLITALPHHRWLAGGCRCA